MTDPNQPTLDDLITMLGSSEPRVRQRAYDLIGQRHDPQTIAALAAFVDDPNPQRRLWAAIALSEAIPNGAGVAPLLAFLDDPDKEVRYTAAASIPLDADGLAALMSLIHDPTHPLTTRTAAIYGLYRFEAFKAQVWPLLADLIRDVEVEMRASAIDSLGFLRLPEAVPALLEALADESAQVRWLAASALGRLMPEARAVWPLLDCLHDTDADVRYYAAQALGLSDDPQVIPHLMVACDDDAIAVRRGAAWAISEVGGRAELAWLMRLLHKTESGIDHDLLLAIPRMQQRLDALPSRGE